MKDERRRDRALIGDLRASATGPAPLSIERRVVDVLARQKEVLDTPGGWTRGVLGRSVLGEPVFPLSDRACSWSLMGALAPALLAVLGPISARCDSERLYELTVQALWTHLPADQPRSKRMTLDLDAFNDYPGTYFEDVVDLIERAECSARAAELSV